MAEEVLVGKKLEDGAKLIQELRAHQFDVEAAFWMQEEGTYWYLYLVSKLADDQSISLAYRKLGETVGQMKDTSLDLFEMNLIAPTTPLAQEVLDLQSRYTLNLYSQHLLRKVGPMRVGEAHIYPLASVT